MLPLSVFPLGIVAGETRLNEELTPVTFTPIIVLIVSFFTKQFGNQVHPKHIWTAFTNDGVIFLLVRLHCVCVERLFFWAF